MSIPDAKCVVNGHKVNEVIDALNPLLNIKLREGELLSIKYTDNNVMITIPAGGGGLPDGYAEELFDVVLSDNTAGQRYLLSKSV